MENSRDKSSCDALFLRCMRETANCGMILLVAAYNTNSHIRTYKFKNLQLENLGFIISKNIFWTKYECDCVTISEARLFWKFPSWFWRYNLYYSILCIRYETLVFVIIRTDKCKSSWSLFPFIMSIVQRNAVLAIHNAFIILYDYGVDPLAEAQFWPGERRISPTQHVSFG